MWYQTERRGRRKIAGGEGDGRISGMSGRQAAVRVRALCAREVGQQGVTRIIDAVTDGAGLRVMFGDGTAPAALAPDGGPGCALPLDLRAASGGVLGAFATGPVRVALAQGGGLDIAATRAEPSLLGGCNVLAGFRYAETPGQVADWLAYHANHHGATGALILDRAARSTSTARRFAVALAAALAEQPGTTGLPVVVVWSPLPLGKPDLGPETHPFLAPDAPGKDRMERPAPDPWLSALGEGVVLEALKWRFLTAARAVLLLDPCDFLAGSGPSAFDLCVAARRGVITLQGRLAYPWRVRSGAEARMADHICLPFDRDEGPRHWGVAPARAGLENAWRPGRVSFSRPDGEVPFWRAMAIRVPGRASAELAPKTSLVEDLALLALSEGVFGHKPVRAPVSRPRGGDGTGRTAIVTTMKNEGPFILEWLAWHRAIGVNDFLIYTNDCTDGTDTMLQLLQDKGLVQHRENPFRETNLKPQHAALQAAEDEPVMQDCDWGICMDVDEFINIKLGDGRLPTLFAAMERAQPGTNLISLTWRLFGNAEIGPYQDRLIVEQFDRCAPQLIRKPHQAWGFKTLFRNLDIFKKLGVHRPKGLNPDLYDQVRWLNGSGRPMPQTMYRNGWRSTTETWGYDWVQLNHYAVRSAESFLVKRDRGRVNHVDRDQGMNYWFRMNHNVEQDGTLAARLPLLRAEWDRLLSDPDIQAAHDFSVAAHRAKIAELRATESYEAFYRELTGERMQWLCRHQRHFGGAVFAAGPHVIPADLHRNEVPADFFFTVDDVDEAVH